MTTDSVKIAWIAGIVEGEGAIFVYPKLTRKGERYYAYRVSVNMCDGDVLERLKSWSGLGRLSGPHKNGTTGHRPIYRWNADRRTDIEDFLKAIYPFMGKRRSARIDEVFATMKGNPPRKIWEHGTRQGYETGCRCAGCTAAHTRRFRARRRKLGIPEWKPALHGSRSKYVKGCRCRRCTTANRDYQRECVARRAASVTTL